MRHRLALALALHILAGCEAPATGLDPDGDHGRGPEMVLSPETLIFGEVPVGFAVQRTVEVANRGELDLHISSIREGMPFDDAFTFSIDRTAVSPGGNATLTIGFEPTELRPYAAQIVVRPAHASLTDALLEITGTGASCALIVEPDTIDFGNVVVHTTKTLPITLTNECYVDSQIGYAAGPNVRLCTSGAADPPAFCIRLRDRELGPDDTFTLQAGESATLLVRFTPAIAGSRERGQFTLRGCPGEIGECDVGVVLDGLGVEQGFRCNPTVLEFGSIDPGACGTRTVTCENTANERVTVVDWGIGAGSSADYTASEPQVQILDEGDRSNIGVTYCPDGLGGDTGELRIETDHPDARLATTVIELTGAGGGPDIDVRPTTLDFGLVSLIAPSRRRVTVQNVGFAPLEIREIVADGAGTGAFTAPGASGALLPAGSSLEITVDFAPFAIGPVASTLLIRSDDEDEPEVTVILTGEGVNLPPCHFTVSPAQLAFGAVERGRALGRFLEIRNDGLDDCLLTSARLVAGSDQAFSIPEDDVVSVVIPPGSAHTVRAQYAPAAIGDHTAIIELSISSPTSPFNTVALSGTGTDAALLIVPREIDFAPIGAGCSPHARTVTVYNTGTSAARIDAIDVDGDPTKFTLSNLPPLDVAPLDLPAGGSFTFDVLFHGGATSAYAGAVELTGELGGAPFSYIVSLEGADAPDAIEIDEFVQLDSPKADILFVIDDSPTMVEEQAALAASFDAFIQLAQAQGIDYHLGVTTTDAGGGNPAEAGRLVPLVGTPMHRVATPRSLPNPEVVFTSNVVVGLDGSAPPGRGLEAAYLALSNPLLFGHNQGFLRPDASLAIVVVSDEEDSSPQPVDFYVSFFRSIKGPTRSHLFSLSAIAGPPPNGCSGANSGARYVEAATETGGWFEAICTPDWPRALADLATVAFGFRSSFFLSNPPAIFTIEVYVDGVLLPATSPGGTVNWRYDIPLNAVTFTPVALPGPGARIRIEYMPVCS